MHHAIAADQHRCVETIVDAFDQDPYYRWMFPYEPTFREAMTDWFTHVGGAAFTHGHYYRDDNYTAVQIWLPPDVALAPIREYQSAQELVAHWTSPAHAKSVMEAVGTRAAQRLDGPSWRLLYVATAPAAQSQGAGTAGMTSMLATFDADGAAAFLSSTNPRNLPFFERLGFRVLREVDLPGSGPKLWPMWRDPKAT